MIIAPPKENETFGYYDNYISEVKHKDLLKGLKEFQGSTNNYILSLPEETLNYRYAEGKWSIKEIIGHLIDCEIVFSYRALRFARKDKTPLPSFDENMYAKTNDAGNRDIMFLMREFDAIRNSTIHLFNSFDPNVLDEKGTANNLTMTPRSLGYAILGHEMHHLDVIKERYVKG